MEILAGEIGESFAFKCVFLFYPLTGSSIFQVCFVCVFSRLNVSSFKYPTGKHKFLLWRFSNGRFQPPLAVHVTSSRNHLNDRSIFWWFRLPDFTDNFCSAVSNIAFRFPVTIFFVFSLPIRFFIFINTSLFQLLAFKNNQFAPGNYLMLSVFSLHSLTILQFCRKFSAHFFELNFVANLS